MSNLGPGKVLALDLSSVTGWAFGRPGPECPVWGAVELPKEAGRGAAAATFEDWLDAKIDELQPDIVVYEAPLDPRQQRDTEACFYAFGLAMATEACCFRQSLPFRAHSLSTVRGAVIGRTQLTDEEKLIRPRVTVKSQIIAPWIKAQGWDVTEHNARDAIVVWAYAIGIRHAAFRQRRVA